MNLLFMMFMLPMGVGIASNARTGRYLGANRPSRATRTMRTTLLIVFITQSITLGTVAGVRNHIGTLFTNAPNVLTIVVKVIPMFILLSFFDGVQVSLSLYVFHVSIVFLFPTSHRIFYAYTLVFTL